MLRWRVSTSPETNITVGQRSISGRKRHVTDRLVSRLTKWQVEKDTLNGRLDPVRVAVVVAVLLPASLAQVIRNLSDK